MLSPAQIKYSHCQLKEAAVRWNISEYRAAVILNDAHFTRALWENVNFDEFINTFIHEVQTPEKKIKAKQSYFPVELIKYFIPDWLYRKFSKKVNPPTRYKIKTTSGVVRFRGYFCRYLETGNWHYYETSSGEIIHFRKDHLVYVKGGSSAEVSKNKYY